MRSWQVKYANGRAPRHGRNLDRVRAEEHIALFYPDTEEERTALVRAMLKKSGTRVSPEAERCFVERSVGLSGADIEAVLTRARMQCALGNLPAVGLDDVKAVLDV